MNMDTKFEIVNENNEKITYEILKTFNIDNENYIVYTDNTLTSEGNLDVIINKYEINDGNITLLDIPEDKRKYVDNMWSLLCQDVW